VNQQKYFSHSSPVIYFFPTRPIKLKLGLQNGWETTNSKAQEPVIMIGQSETGSTSQIIFITLLWQVLGFVVPFTSLSKLCKNAGPKPFC
jgi:hypothetical protein